LTLDLNTGAITGMPYSPAGSPFSFTVTATDAAGNSGNQIYSIAVTSPLGTSPNAIYVENLYGLLLHRAADLGGGAFWVGQLNQGVSPSNLVIAIESSYEYLSNVVTGIYLHYLHRSPDPVGLSFWVGQLQHGETIEQVIQGFISSSEFYQVQGDNNNTGFVTIFYMDVLNRNPDQSGLNFWVNALNTGALTRAGMAWDFLTSQEYRDDVVNSYYQEFLHRNADPGGLAYWTGEMAAGLTDQQVLAAILGAPEPYNDWS
jgi:hypothetical protein